LVETMSADPPAARAGRPRALLFDAGNTLLRMNYEAIAAELGRRGLTVAPEEIEEAEILARVRLDPYLSPGGSTESGRTHDRYLRFVLERFQIIAEADVQALAAWRARYNPPVGLWNQAEPTAAEILRGLKRAGLVTGVISNSNGSVGSVLEETGLTAHLDFVIDSGVVGVEKPDRRIFELALATAKVAAADAVYVGDLYSVDVIGARGAGLRAILLDPRGHWGNRDCLRARSLADAVRLALAGG
jgi:HAD superfamily hydrolase (TIGR01509 family)